MKAGDEGDIEGTPFVEDFGRNGNAENVRKV